MNENICTGASAVQFEGMHEKLRDSAERFIYYLIGDSPDSDDIIQEVFIRLWIKWDSLQHLPESEILNYLFIAIRNFIINRRRQYNRPKWNKEKFLLEYSKVSCDHYWHEDILVKEGLVLHYKAVDQLSKKEKIVYLLFQRENLSAEEIAKVLNKKRQTVHNQLSTAFKSVKSYLNRNYDLNLCEGRKCAIKQAVLN